MAIFWLRGYGNLVSFGKCFLCNLIIIFTLGDEK